MIMRLNNEATRDLVEFGFKVFLKHANGGSPGGISEKTVKKLEDLDDWEKSAWYAAVTAIAMSVNSGKLRHDLFQV